MTTPIRITYRENADYFIEAQNQSPPPLGKQISPKTQRILLLTVAVITVIFAFAKEFYRKQDIGLLICGVVFFLVIGAFWFWLFRKLGLFKNNNYQDYRWTKKDRDRFERHYIKIGGDTGSLVMCELDDNGVRFNPGHPKSKAYKWDEIVRVIERPKGLLIYVKSWMHFWFPRAAFASPEEYQSALELVNARTKVERLNLPAMAFVALGTNLGDRVETLIQAFQCLREVSDYPMLKSSLWETTPVDCPPDSPMFLNAVAALTPKAGETPESLLTKLLQIEKKFGRIPKKVINEARPLDLDLIAFGNEVRATPELTLPHPRAHLRRFVLEPLAEIASDWILPKQVKTVSDLLRGLTSAESVRKLP